MNALLFTAAIVAPKAFAHSWLECTNYGDSVTSNVYAVDACEGFMRNWHHVRWNDGFGADNGMNYQPGSGPLCRDKLYGGSYSAEFPMSEYSIGETISLLWPAKNHDAEDCTNPYIPSTATKLYVTCDYNNDMDVASLEEDWDLVEDWGPDGFQNCPFFCDNTDKAICTQDFKVPNVPCTVPTFLWYWAFNSDSDLYTACFEADIREVGKPPDPDPPSTPAPSPTSPKTSAPSVSGCACDNDCSVSRMWKQCGGQNYRGETCCPSGSSCDVLNEYYAQCR
jgi:hypothetical protein